MQFVSRRTDLGEGEVAPLSSSFTVSLSHVLPLNFTETVFLLFTIYYLGIRMIMGALTLDRMFIKVIGFTAAIATHSVDIKNKYFTNKIK
jgi:hypothetical protein